MRILSFGLGVLFLVISAQPAMAQQKRYKRKSPVSYTDSATFPGYTYYKASGFKKWLMGANYRKEWVQPVRVPVFHISKEKGGLTIEKMGGGLQTKSLRLEDKNGEEYVLRSIEKFPENNIPEEFRNTFVKDALVDGISASYPYAALSIPPLARAAHVPHAEPRLVYVPDDPALGEYRSVFANTLCIFEEHEPGGFDKNINTENLLEKLHEDNDKQVIQEAVLKARLLDLFIMDFDRHDDQWRWGTNDTSEHKYYFPIPRDRDQAFFINDGFIPKIVAKSFPKFQGFSPKAKNINTFNSNAINFDRTFLNEMTEEDWGHQADTLLMQMTDSVIDVALSKQPPEVQSFAAGKIKATLKERRQYLKDEALTYYHFLSKNVMIAGSDKDEFFDVEVKDNKEVAVTVYNLNNEKEPGRTLYSRTFLPGETKEVQLFGLGRKDSFLVKGNTKTPIRIRLIGGRGDDVFVLQNAPGKKRIYIYDSLAENNTFVGHGFRNRLSNVDTIHSYDRENYMYDKFSIGPAFGYNRDEGISAGIGFKQTVYGFRKLPYKFHQQFYIRYAFATKAVTADYTLTATDVWNTNDLLFNASLNLPRNTINFFGFGNETVFKEFNNESINFYRTKIKHFDMNTLMRFPLSGNASLAVGPAFNYYHLERDQNEGKISYYPSQAGLDSAGLYDRKNYVGPMAVLEVDSRGGDFYTTSGVHWTTDANYNAGINKTPGHFFKINTDFSWYTSLFPNERVVLAVRVGGGLNAGDYEFYQSQYLNGNKNLRGYRNYRFAGDKMLYNNLELRVRIADFETYLLPGAIGVLAFHDVGRVWYKKEKSDVWHSGYGGGIWLAPAKKMVIAAMVGKSKEGWLPTASIGFRF